ncbi:SPOC like C-terminal domain-containing protein [Haematococcus lacustris]
MFKFRDAAIPIAMDVLAGDEDEVYAVDEEATGDDAAVGITKEHIVFLVDASDNLFRTRVPEGLYGQTCYELAKQAILEFMQSKAAAASKDEVAVVFYNTTEMLNDLHLPHVYVLVARSQPSVDNIRKLLELSAHDFMNDIGSLQAGEGQQQQEAVAKSAAEALHAALWTAHVCLQGGRGGQARVGYRLIIFSNTEDPLTGQTASMRQHVLDRARPLHDLQTSCRFFPLVAAVRPFDSTLFWDDLLALLPDPEDETGAPGHQEEGQLPSGALKQEPVALPPRRHRVLPASFRHPPLTTGGPAGAAGGADSDVFRRLDELRALVRLGLTRPRPSSSLTFTLAPGLDIACQCFTLVAEASRPLVVKLTRDTLEPVKADTALVNQADGTLVRQVAAKAFVAHGSKTCPSDRFPKVVLQQQEIQELKRMKPPGLVLLGTKPLDCLKDHYNVTHSTFLRPKEQAVAGSTAGLKALLDALQETGRFALCRCVKSKAALPTLVALLPQPEILNPAGIQELPEGLHMIPLPFRDDLRAPEADPAMVGLQVAFADSLQVAVAAQLVAAWTLPYTTGGISNPSLQRHFDVLQHLALYKEPPNEEEVEDGTLGRPVTDPQVLSALARFQAEVLDPLASLPSPVKLVGGTKRKAADAAGELSIGEQYALGIGGHKWADVALDMGKLEKRTAEDLKIYLKYHGLKLSGRKAELCARIREHAMS